MFEGFTRKQTTRLGGQRLAALLVAFLLHAGVAVAFLAGPARGDDGGDSNDVPVLFYAPPPPPPPPPPPAASTAPARPTRVREPIPTDLSAVLTNEAEPEPQPEQEPEPEPETAAEPEAGGEEGGEAGGVEGGQLGGELGGEVGGELGGEVGGELGGTVGGTVGGQVDTPVRLKRDMIPPVPLPSTMIEPEYPRTLREQRIEGRVLLLIAIDRDGRVVDVQIRSGHPTLARAAEQAVRQWRFSPATHEGKPITVWLPYPFDFRIED